MASEVDICNLALSHLGDEATVASISPPEGSAQSAHCARFYPMARDAVLEAHDWSFATRRVALAATGTPPGNWQYSYAIPADCVRTIAVLADGASNDNSEDYIREGDYIYCNTATATLRYVALITDTTKFSPNVVNAISWLLALYLNGPITKGEKSLEQKCQTMYVAWLGMAQKADSNAQQVTSDYKPAWMANR